MACEHQKIGECTTKEDESSDGLLLATVILAARFSTHQPVKHGPFTAVETHWGATITGTSGMLSIFAGQEGCGHVVDTYCFGDGS